MAHFEGKYDMRFTGELKEKAEQAESKEEAKQTIQEAGMNLNDEELDQVTGGAHHRPQTDVVHHVCITSA